MVIMEHSLFSVFCSVCSFRSRQKCAWAKGRISPQLHLLFFLILHHCVLFAFCNTPSFFPFQASLIMYELAWKMSKDSNDLLWWAAIGLTHQYLYERIDRYLGRLGSLSLTRMNMKTCHLVDHLAFHPKTAFFDHQKWSFLKTVSIHKA